MPLVAATDYNSLQQQLACEAENILLHKTEQPLAIQQIWDEFYDEEQVQPWTLPSQGGIMPGMITLQDTDNRDLAARYPQPAAGNKPEGLLIQSNKITLNQFSEYQQKIFQFKDSAQHRPSEFLFDTVKSRKGFWRDLGANNIILDWIENGVTFPLETKHIPPFHHKSSPIPQPELKYWYDILLPHYLATGAIKPIDLPPRSQRYISRCHFEPKSSGGFRLVVDLRLINKYFPKISLKYETLAMLKYAPPAVEFGISIDISDAYHHLKLSEKIQHFFQFVIDGQCYQCLGLPFGWSLAPLAFSKFMRVVIQAIRNPDTIAGSLTNTSLVHAYRNNQLGNYFASIFLDDLLALTQTVEQATMLSQGIVQLFGLLGLVFHPSKSQLAPVQKITHLGFLLDIKKRLFLLTEKQYQKLSTRTTDILQVANARKRCVQKRHLARVIGYLQSTTLAIPGGQQQLVSLYIDLNKAGKGWSNSIVAKLSKQSITCLKRFWGDMEHQPIGKPWGPPERTILCNLTISTDASKTAWGASIHDSQLSGDKDFQFARRAWPQENRDMHIYLLELIAVKEALLAFENHITGKMIRLLCDNQTVISILQKQHCKAPAAIPILKEILDILQSHKAELVVQYIRSKDNTVSDTLSRIPLGDRYTINPLVLQQIQSVFGTITCDRFATAQNTVCKKFNSYFYEPGCNGVDAFAQTNWNLELNWVHPPISQLDRTVKFITSIVPLAKCLVLCPTWKAQNWYQILLHIADYYCQAPIQQTLFVPTLSSDTDTITYLRNSKWQMTLFAINCQPSSSPQWLTQKLNTHQPHGTGVKKRRIK